MNLEEITAQHKQVAKDKPHALCYRVAKEADKARGWLIEEVERLQTSLDGADDVFCLQTIALERQAKTIKLLEHGIRE